MRRADRLFQIVQALRGGRRTTAAALAEKLEVSRRTIYRDIADLQSTGVPIDGEAGFGYVMQEGFDLPPLMFDSDEIVALVAGARLVQAWGGAAMARAAEEALAKIDAVLPAAARARARAVHVHSLGLGLAPDLRARIDRIEQAVEQSERLELAYRDEAGAKTTRVVRPLGLWFWAPAWTLVSWCELREDFRMFRLDRIARMTDAGRFRPERGRKLSDFYASMQDKDRDIVNR
ncbi:helix-turn-helix transcriptional regulator [Antarctobacter heliothermus]|uniref:Predicted DNA-binding transcriptional regulator YafY, contains an HTH and WYL domains n=1 Tax=Antarctobacter heliothermus TaxID=74033 RepID=A0A239FBF1_9RHOB|nr:YafY family protein [Antarctobacter heliothermus]SNS54370.1 Predicted DNA-binding transcriptional regulator YafY, contains an HTH and WYL domains [Antarctobacter heliothermus]